MGEYGAKLIKNKDSVMTICNAGGLATVDYGTALGVFYSAKAKGKKFKVYACETRPLLQGARLTAWELMRARIDTTLICDSMAAVTMRQKNIKAVFTGADRIAANGDSANKIGTYSLAVLAKHHRIPFYIVAPYSTFDLKTAEGQGIPIEERGKEEVVRFSGTVTAPKDVKVFNPAFDVTDNKLITAIITEYGIIYPPFKKNIKKTFQRH
jgi:methylthioribose-1-phosphate isomerase